MLARLGIAQKLGAGFGIIILIICVLIGVVLSSSIRQRLDLAVEAARQIAAGRLDLRIDSSAQMAQSSSQGISGASRSAATIEQLARDLDAQVAQFKL